ncbi:hypothetical protein F53441_6875 [Fusarium austroafricanum]|uniref:Uncharacterized protein n=1 Tax=Fusarium austroafricanum TaxID=2364996 RepID=A0A8H4NZ28_9HYPO|nr:hypothetical protein F53441_6875 [Fusarium austroafricanum]
MNGEITDRAYRNAHRKQQESSSRADSGSSAFSRGTAGSQSRGGSTAFNGSSLEHLNKLLSESSTTPAARTTGDRRTRTTNEPVSTGETTPRAFPAAKSSQTSSSVHDENAFIRRSTTDKSTSHQEEQDKQKTPQVPGSFDSEIKTPKPHTRKSTQPSTNQLDGEEQGSNKALWFLDIFLDIFPRGAWYLLTSPLLRRLWGVIVFIAAVAFVVLLFVAKNFMCDHGVSWVAPRFCGATISSKRIFPECHGIEFDSVKLNIPGIKNYMENSLSNLQGDISEDIESQLSMGKINLAAWKRKYSQGLEDAQDVENQLKDLLQSIWTQLDGYMSGFPKHTSQRSWVRQLIGLHSAGVLSDARTTTQDLLKIMRLAKEKLRIKSQTIHSGINNPDGFVNKLHGIEGEAFCDRMNHRSFDTEHDPTIQGLYANARVWTAGNDAVVEDLKRQAKKMKADVKWFSEQITFLKEHLDVITCEEGFSGMVNGRLNGDAAEDLFESYVMKNWEIACKAREKLEEYYKGYEW